MSERTGWLLTLDDRPPMGGARHRWHVAINACSAERGHGDMRFMYEAKEMADEVPRIAYLFAQERAGNLAETHRQCSHAEPVPVPENHLTCCKGVRCSKCPYLLAIEAADLTDAEKDTAKAWTCAAHIVTTGGDTAREGYVLTVDDRMYWNRVYESLSTPSGHPDDDPPSDSQPADTGTGT